MKKLTMVKKSPPNTLIGYAERLAWAMAAAGYDTTKLSKELGLSYQAVKKAETGKSKSLSAYNNDIAASILGVPSKWLATGKFNLAEVQQPQAIDSANITETVKIMRTLSDHEQGMLLVYIKAFVSTLPPNATRLEA